MSVCCLLFFLSLALPSLSSLSFAQTPEKSEESTDKSDPAEETTPEKTPEEIKQEEKEQKEKQRAKQKSLAKDWKKKALETQLGSSGKIFIGFGHFYIPERTQNGAQLKPKTHFLSELGGGYQYYFTPHWAFVFEGSIQSLFLKTHLYEDTSPDTVPFSFLNHSLFDFYTVAARYQPWTFLNVDAGFTYGTNWLTLLMNVLDTSKVSLSPPRGISQLLFAHFRVGGMYFLTPKDFEQAQKNSNQEDSPLIALDWGVQISLPLVGKIVKIKELSTDPQTPEFSPSTRAKYSYCEAATLWSAQIGFVFFF